MNESLFQIESTLQQLADARTDAIAADDTEAVNAIDLQIRNYLTKEAAKIDSYAGLIRRTISEAVDLEEEAERLTARAANKRRMVEDMKENAVRAMQITGVTRFETPRNVLRRQKNGGKQTLYLYNSEELPEDCINIRALVPLYLWPKMLEALEPSQRIKVKDMFRQVDEDAIRDRLRFGPVPGVRLVERGEHLRVE